MTTTPTIWKPTFFPNFANPAGNQSVPQSIGLANGNILTVWQDDTNGPSPGFDIMGRISSPEGVAEGIIFQVNSAIVGSNETAPKIVALPDGGYVVAYGSDILGVGGVLQVERFDRNGNEVFSNSIVDDRDSLTKWELTADSGGNYTVVFERLFNTVLGTDPPYSIDVHSITYDHATNARGPERENAARNIPDEPDNLAAVASFANGHIVTLAQEPNFTFTGSSPVETTEFTISDPQTGDVIRNERIAGEASQFGTDSHAFPQDVAVLTGGQFVILYQNYDQDSGGTLSNDDLFMKICSGEAGSVGAAIRIPTGTPSALHNAHVVALGDGGFFAAWADGTDHALHGQRYTASGATIGDAFQFATDASVVGFATNRLSLTADGRILVPYWTTSREIAEVILDPRSNFIDGTDADEVLTTQIDTTVILGEGGNDALLAQGGADFLDGGAGADTLRGGAGNDTYILKDIYRPDPLLPQFAYDSVVEAAGGGIDTVEVQRATLGQFSKASYTLGANVENGIVTGPDGFTLTGNALDNVLTGNAAANTLDGRLGRDTLKGSDGNDFYYVDSAGDVVIEAAGGGTDRVVTSVSYTLRAGQSIETVTPISFNTTTNINLTGNALAQAITGNAGNNVISDGGAGAADSMNGLAGNDTYIVNNSGDTVTEASRGGTDRVATSADYVLGAGQEIETLAPTSYGTTTSIDLTGNDLVQAIIGNAGANVIDGKGGNDTLTGMGGNDAFLFDTALNASTNVDRITDFAVGADMVELSHAIFGALPTGALAPGAFFIGSAAHAASDRIVYNSGTGALLYDADGNGAGAATRFATLSAGLTALSASQFKVVA